MGNFPEQDLEFFLIHRCMKLVTLHCSRFSVIAFEPQKAWGPAVTSAQLQEYWMPGLLQQQGRGLQNLSWKTLRCCCKGPGIQRILGPEDCQWIQCSLVSSVDKVRWRFWREQSCNHCCGICTCKNLHLNLLPKCHACKGGWLMRLADGQYVLRGGGWAQ